MRTDEVDGFRLDRGFQVLLTAYPTARALLDMDALDLAAFRPGARVRIADRDTVITDPLRQPSGALRTLLAPVGTVADKLRVAALARSCRRDAERAPLEFGERTTLELLRETGLSPRIIEAFFRPFFAGVFLERGLTTPAEMFRFVLGCFALGDAALPEGGMQQIPEQLAERVGADRLWLERPVAEVAPDGARLEDGRSVTARTVVVATDGDQTGRWTGSAPDIRWNGGTIFYFDAPRSPFPERERLLWLNGSGQGRINQIAVVSDVARGYAPPGRALLSVGTVGEPVPTLDTVRAELEEHLAPGAAHWRFLRAYTIPRSLPAIRPGTAPPFRRIDGVWYCGDCWSAGSIEHAMLSGVGVANELTAGDAD